MKENNKTISIGADIGGSHISCAAIDLGNGLILKESFTTVEVDNHASASAILNQWCLALSTTISKIDKSQLAGIGFAMPGPFEYENGIALFTPAVAKFENLYGIDVASSLKQILGLQSDVAIRFMNDAVSFAVGEAWIGQAKGFERALCVTIGTGFGSSFIERGIPVVDRSDVPTNGYVYHLPFKNGIADEYFSTRWFVQRYAEKCGKTVPRVKEIAEAAHNEQKAKDVFLEFGQNLGYFLTPILQKFDAKTLVIGGNIAGAYNLFATSFSQLLIENKINIPVKISELKEDAALIGSARLLDPLFWSGVSTLLSKM